MNNRIVRYFWPALIILLIFLWIKRDHISMLLSPRPKAESLEYNQPERVSEVRPIVISKDEEINIDVFKEVHPAVVNIVATTLSFNFWMQIVPKEGQGSGFIIDRDGYILTNNHVVEDAQKIIVTLSGGRKLDATLVGRDPTSDLAVIKIPSNDIYTVARLGDSDQVRVGQKAIAIGNPFGLSHTLTTGIVSAKNRSLMTSENTQMEDLIQTDAAINPGNSGGPLLNSTGEVIGINTAIFSLSGGYQGIGFAIPINRAKDIATQLITTGKVARPWLGVVSVTVTKDLSQGLGLGIDSGILIVQIVRGSPADLAGLRGGNRRVIIGGMELLIGGDIITSIDGYPVRDNEELVRVLNKLKVGEKVVFQVFRERQLMEIEVTLYEKI